MSVRIARPGVGGGGSIPSIAQADVWKAVHAGLCGCRPGEWWISSTEAVSEVPKRTPALAMPSRRAASANFRSRRQRPKQVCLQTLRWHYGSWQPRKAATEGRHRTSWVNFTGMSLPFTRPTISVLGDPGNQAGPAIRPSERGFLIARWTKFYDLSSGV
ncbi:hypothetical protein BGZ61DRAFT_545848 [Ilyonectria robusta]|uniref:uncharacterized protein n=1 Tax=Ilyonectria robusta TaxID=1079257 RepID=UPI001E8E5D89|nr:uncharacterized protein BGZ61DRAFT_545848 [Ilyonectria robusta]KAH8650423.1 hypothetical protein BGZ61DRAFT_545848 [Ilyonectria robusta]